MAGSWRSRIDDVIDPLQVITGKTFIIEGVFQAIGKDYVKTEGEHGGVDRPKAARQSL